MQVLLVGATGMVGRALSRRLRRDGHEVTAAVRSIQRARNTLGPELELVALGDNEGLRQAVERADALINLAGESIASRAWTRDRKQALYDSRVQLTAHLAERIRQAWQPPRVFICASAIGYYADLGDTPQDETMQPARNFLGTLCTDWESAARGAEDERTRVVCLRTGVVLDAEGGALSTMLPAFRMGVAGRVGDGRQYFSWIHLDDLLGIISFALSRDDLSGPVNATAPAPVTNAELTKTLAGLLNRPAVLPAPAWALRLALGERASLLLASQRVVPRALERMGYAFAYPTLRDALGEILGRLEGSACIARIKAGDLPADAPRSATHLLEQITDLDAPLDRVFPFFSRAENLAWITPSWMGFAISGQPPTMARDVRIAYRIKLGPLPMTWRTRITIWEPGERFVDDQESGPYSVWWHEHRFEARDGHTRMTDRVYFRLPLGILGSWVAGWLVRRTLRRVFAYRAQAMAQRFGTPRVVAVPRHHASAHAAAG